MRLLQLVTGDDEMLDLHPQVSVVRPSDPGVRAQLVATIAGLARNEATGAGLLEAHGVLFDLDAALLSLLDRRAEVDPVIRAGDLPGGAPVDGALLREAQAALEELRAQRAAAVEARQEVARAVEEAIAALEQSQRAHGDLVLRRQRLEVEAAPRRAEADASQRRARTERQERQARRARAADDLERAERARRAAAARLEERSAETAQLRARHDELVRQRDELQSRLRPEAADELAAALVDAQAAAGGHEARPGEPGAPVPPGRGADLAAGPGPATDPDTGAEALAARLAVIEEVLAELDGSDPGPVQAALEGVRSPVPLVPSAAAAALADQLAALEEQISAVEAGGVPDLSVEESTALARELEAARAAVADAEDAARAHTLGPEDAAALEAAHAALHDALERGESRLGGRRARGQVDRLRAEEQALLDRLGFVTYAEYLMGTSPVHRRPETEAALADARERLASLEGTWAELEERRRAVLAYGQLLEQRRQRVAAARALLGEGAPADGDLVSALRAMRVPAVALDERAQVLARALAAAGIEVDAADLDVDDLAALADAWLAEVAGVDRRRASLRQAQAEVSAALASARAAGSPPADDRRPSGRSRPVPAGPSAQPSIEAADQPAVAAVVAGPEDATLAAEAAQDRWEAHETARAMRAEYEGALERSGPALESAEEALAAARRAMEEAAAAVAEAERALGAVDEPAPLAPSPPSPPAPDEPVDADPGDDGALEALRRDEAAAAATVERAQLAHRRARERLERVEQEVADLSTRGQEAAVQLRALQELGGATGGAAPADPAELEWYLVARVAAQRSVSVAGSTPLLLDDPFGGLSEDQVHHLLGRLERVAETVQIIVVSDHPGVDAWVRSAGEARAALVEPTPAAALPLG